jgi:hypothetical protein
MTTSYGSKRPRSKRSQSDSAVWAANDILRRYHLFLFSNNSYGTIVNFESLAFDQVTVFIDLYPSSTFANVLPYSSSPSASAPGPLTSAWCGAPRRRVRLPIRLLSRLILRNFGGRLYTGHLKLAQKPFPGEAPAGPAGPAGASGGTSEKKGDDPLVDVVKLQVTFTLERFSRLIADTPSIRYGRQAPFFVLPEHHNIWRLRPKKATGHPPFQIPTTLLFQQEQEGKSAGWHYFPRRSNPGWGVRLKNGTTIRGMSGGLR